MNPGNTPAKRFAQSGLHPMGAWPLGWGPRCMTLWPHTWHLGLHRSVRRRRAGTLTREGALSAVCLAFVAAFVRHHSRAPLAP